MGKQRGVDPRNFLGELKRRNVYKVAVAYAVVSWLLIQVATQVFPFFEIPNWAVRLVILLLMLGFPVALILAWAGAQDEAVELLEGLSNGFPGVGPAEITRDPLYRVPLVNNPRYKALEQKLEVEIAANQRLFDQRSSSSGGA